MRYAPRPLTDEERWTLTLEFRINRMAREALAEIKAMADQAREKISPTRVLEISHDDFIRGVFTIPPGVTKFSVSRWSGGGGGGGGNLIGGNGGGSSAEGPFCGDQGRHCVRKDNACLTAGSCVGLR